MAIRKLIDIRALFLLNTSDALAQAISIMYTLAVSGTQRSLSLVEQLSLLSLPLTTCPIPTYTDNSVMPSFPFIMGLLLGDGSLVLRLR